MSFKEWLDPTEWRELFVDLSSSTWTDGELFFLAVVVVAVSGLAAILTILSRSPRGKYGGIVIFTPVIYLFAANVFEHVSESIVPSLFIATAITMAFQWTMVVRARRQVLS